MTQQRPKLNVVDIIVESFKASARGERGLPVEMENQLRAEQAERDINEYRGLLNEWEQEFKERYGEDSQEYKELIADNQKTRTQLDEDLQDLDNPQTQTKAIEFYRSIVLKYRHWEVGENFDYKQVRREREPGVL